VKSRVARDLRIQKDSRQILATAVLARSTQRSGIAFDPVTTALKPDDSAKTFQVESGLRSNAHIDFA